MDNVHHNVRFYVISVALSAAFGCPGIALQRLSAQTPTAPQPKYSFQRMADGKQWTTRNLDVDVKPSYCFNDAGQNCQQYGRLYTWDSAKRACQALGDKWRLPTDDEWRQMAKHYGGVSQDSEDKGTVAFKALSAGGSSGFNALFGGGRSAGGEYARLEAHGFYWTMSETDPATAWYYNFARNGLALHRQDGGEKERAFSVRCVRD